MRGQVNASLSIPQVIDACQTLPRTLTITNPTQIDVLNASVTLDSASDWEIVGGSITSTIKTGQSFSAATDTVTLGTLAAGETVTVDLELRLPLNYSSDDLELDRTWDSLQSANSGASQFTAATTVSPVLVREADILVQITPSRQTVDSRSWSWNVFLTNAGSGTAVGIEMVDTTPNELTNITVTSINKEAVNGSTSDISSSVTQTTPSGVLNLSFDSSVTLAPGETIIVVVSGTVDDTIMPEPTVADLGTHTVQSRWGCDGEFSSYTQATQTYRETLTRLDYAIGATDSISNLTTSTTVDVCDTFFVYPVIRNSGQSTVHETEWSITLPAGFELAGSDRLAFRTSTSAAFVDDTSITLSGQTLTVTGLSTAPAGSLAKVLAELDPVGTSGGIEFSTIARASNSARDCASERHDQQHG